MSYIGTHCAQNESFITIVIQGYCYKVFILLAVDAPVFGFLVTSPLGFKVRVGSDFFTCINTLFPFSVSMFNSCKFLTITGMFERIVSDACHEFTQSIFEYLVEYQTIKTARCENRPQIVGHHSEVCIWPIRFLQNRFLRIEPTLWFQSVNTDVGINLLNSLQFIVNF